MSTRTRIPRLVPPAERRPAWAGWLPDPVQIVANAAARAGLLPVVCEFDGESFDLFAPGDRYLACVGMIGERVSLFVMPDDEPEPADDGDGVLGDDDSWEIRGLEQVLAWVAGAVDTITPPR